MNCWNSALTKFVTLSVTTMSGIPNSECNLSTVATAVVEVIEQTSSHLECASIATKNLCPRYGPA